MRKVCQVIHQLFVHCDIRALQCLSQYVHTKCRCHRLNKACEAAPTIRKKRATRKANLSKTAALEEKLDGIVNLLNSRTQLPQISSPNTPNKSQNDLLDTFTQPSEAAATRYAPPTPVASSVSTTSPPFPNIDYHCPNSNHLPTSYPIETDTESDAILETYRTRMIPFFPVAIINPRTTVQEMQNKQPFLWLVIRSCCSKSQARQNVLELEVRKNLAQAVLMDCSKTLDLLFGVLVYAAWCHYYIYKKRVISTVIQIGMSMAGDMGLTKPIPVEVHGVMREFNAQGCPKLGRSDNPVRTIEERRAVVGLFYVSSL
jgi:hypothetical protein